MLQLAVVSSSVDFRLAILGNLPLMLPSTTHLAMVKTFLFIRVLVSAVPAKSSVFTLIKIVCEKPCLLLPDYARPLLQAIPVGLYAQ